jgi:hypothetical protein
MPLVKPQMPALNSQLLLEGLVLGIASALRGQQLSPRDLSAFNLRSLVQSIAGAHTAFASLMRLLQRLGPEEYLRRELRRWGEV